MDHANVIPDSLELIAINVHLVIIIILHVLHAMQLQSVHQTDNVIQQMDHVNVILDSPD